MKTTHFSFQLLCLLLQGKLNFDLNIITLIIKRGRQLRDIIKNNNTSKMNFIIAKIIIVA